MRREPNYRIVPVMMIRTFKTIFPALAVGFGVSLFATQGMAQDVTGDPARGQALMLEMKCTKCHGDSGIGHSETPGVPRLDGQFEPYLVNQLFNFRDGRRPHKFMELYAGRLDGQTVRDIAAFYACQGDTQVEDKERCTPVR